MANVVRGRAQCTAPLRQAKSATQNKIAQQQIRVHTFLGSICERTSIKPKHSSCRGSCVCACVKRMNQSTKQSANALKLQKALTFPSTARVCSRKYGIFSPVCGSSNCKLDQNTISSRARLPLEFRCYFYLEIQLRMHADVLIMQGQQPVQRLLKQVLPLERGKLSELQSFVNAPELAAMLRELF